MPTISAIPDAAALHTQLDQLHKAIAGIEAGSGVTNMTFSAPASDDPMVFPVPIMVALDPPITNPTTLGTLQIALQAQADEITQQLVDQGYTDDDV